MSFDIVTTKKFIKNGAFPICMTETTETDFESIRELSWELKHGIHRPLPNGFFNFQKLEYLLERNGLLTDYNKQLISEAELLVGIPDLNALTIQAASHLERISGRALSYDEKNALIDDLRSSIFIPKYGDCAAWYDLGEVLQSTQGEMPVNLSDGWQARYWKWYEGVQISKQTPHIFVSISCPRLNFGGRPEPYFELFGRRGKEEVVKDKAVSYGQISLICRQECYEEPPLQSEIEKAIETEL